MKSIDNPLMVYNAEGEYAIIPAALLGSVDGWDTTTPESAIHTSPPLYKGEVTFKSKKKEK